MIPAAGTCVVDERTGRVGKVMGNIGPNLQLRPLGGGREWECPPSEVRRATEWEQRHADVLAENYRFWRAGL